MGLLKDFPFWYSNLLGNERRAGNLLKASIHDKLKFT